MNSLIDSLNPQQRAAVTLPDVSSLILAGAGSGKTRVLTSRIAYLLQNGYASPEEILAVTFTNKAAKEMVSRLSTMVSFNTKYMWIGTFHGLCNRMLHSHHEQAGLPATFTILDQSDQLSTIKRLMKANNVSEDEVSARDIQHFINQRKEEGRRASQVKVLGYLGQLKLQVYQWYEDSLNKEGGCDFAELLLRSYELLSRNEQIRHYYQRRFRFILVDEFQDTNVLQYRWLKLLSGIEDNCERVNAVFAVGDDDQSIYAFRGANVGNMKDFVRDFRVQNPIRLEQNYRSHGNILDAANALISNNSERLGKKLWTDAGRGDPIRVFGAVTDQEEAEFLVDSIKGAIADGVDRKEIAILYRSNAQSRVIETELTRRNVPYKVYGGLRFYDRAEIKHTLAYMRLAENTADDSAFLRVVNFPARGIGAKTIEVLMDVAKNENLSLFDATRLLPKTASQKLSVFTQIIEYLKLAKEQLELPDFVDFTVEKSGLKHFYETEKNSEDKLENILELKSAAQAYLSEEQTDSNSGTDTLSPLAGFLSHASLESGENQAKANEDAVQLMTVHASKGLEFNLVFITGLERGLFPHDSAINDDKNGLEEERRLMYVAITRARKSLYLTYAQQRMMHGLTRYNMRSPFFDELPAQTLKWLTPKEGERSSDRYSCGGSSLMRDYQSAEKSRHYSSNTPTWAEGIVTSKLERDIRRQADAGNPYRQGVRISHEKFGPGRITSTRNSGDSHEMTVTFDSGKVLTLLTRIAKNKITLM